MTSFDAARSLAENLLAAQRPDLWARAQRAAIRARELADETRADLGRLMTAAVLHPVGASPVVRRTGDPQADAARFLRVRGVDPAVAALVGGGGADPEATALRRCLDELDAEARRRPPPDVVAQARANPGTWVYEIDGGVGPDDTVAPAAIRGAWAVDDAGEITGSFVPNPNHRAAGGGDA